MTGKGISISDLTFHTDLSQLDLNKAKGISPVLSHISSPASVTGSGVPTHITGIVSIHLTNLEIGAPGVLTASGEAALTDCVIEHFNIVKEVLFYTLGTIPGLFEVAGNFFNGVLNNKLGGDNTIIEKARAQFSIQKHTLFIKDSLVQTKAFDFTANGSVDGGLNTSLQTMLRLNEDVSASLKDKVNMLGSLMGDDKRIAIPARLSGVFPHLEYKPDKEFRKKAKKAFMKEGPKQIINDVLKNLLQ